MPEPVLESIYKFSLILIELVPESIYKFSLILIELVPACMSVMQSFYHSLFSFFIRACACLDVEVGICCFIIACSCLDVKVVFF